MVRLFVIVWTAIRFLARYGLQGGEGDHRLAADDLRRRFEDLGTTFVKLGQLLSVRRDLLPDPYVEAFQALQDRVPPFPGHLAREEIERTLGISIPEIFSFFDEQPLAAASIAQVHAAVLAKDGRKVIVKVRRPGVVPQVSRDMRLLRRAARTASFFSSTIRQFDPGSLVDELEENLRREMDFRHEARNIKRFRAAFRHSPTVYVPPLVDEWFSESVLVQVRCYGRRIDDPSVRRQGKEFANNFVDAYIFQFFSLGTFHADPHPGNLLFMEDGRICFHDYGLVGFINHRTQLALAAFLQALVYLDSEWLLDAYLDLGIFGGEVDRHELELGLENILADYAALPVKHWSFAEAFISVARLGKGRNIRLPHNLLIMMRAVFLMENVVATLDPDYVIVDRLQQTASGVAGREGLAEASLAMLRSEAGVLASDGLRLLARFFRGLRSRESQSSRKEQPGPGSLKRVARAIVIAGLLVSGAMFNQADSGPNVLGMPVVSLLVYVFALWLLLRR